MSKAKSATIEVQGTVITVLSQKEQDFICLTDIAKKFGDDILIYSWMRNRNTLEFIGVWEQIHNPKFKGLEFETFRNQAGLPQGERLKRLNQIAIRQMQVLTATDLKVLPGGKEK